MGSNGAGPDEDAAGWRPAPPGDPQAMAGVPILSADAMRYRSRATIPHVAGLEAADRALALRRFGELERGEAQARDVLERIAAETRAKLRRRMLELGKSASARLTPLMRVLVHRATAVIDHLERSGVADDDERLLLLSYVVWPGESDPHFEAVTTGEVREAGEADFDAFLAERCELGVGETDAGDVSRAYAKWCAARGLVAPHWRTVTSRRLLPKHGLRTRRVYRRGGHVHVLPLELRASG